MPQHPSALAQLLALLDEAFDTKAWHGTTLRGSLRGVSPRQAAWRPGPGRHNIWEVTVHAAYWKYAVRRRLARAPRGGFGLAGSNWFVRPGRGAADWTADVRMLADEHRRLRDTIAGLPAAALDRRPPDRGATAAFLIRGIAAHDLYHAGQIQLLKRLQRTRR